MINRHAHIENIEVVFSIEMVNNADLILSFLLVVWDRFNYNDGTVAVVNRVVSGAKSKVATDDESVEAEALDLGAKSLVYVVVHVLDVKENSNIHQRVRENCGNFGVHLGGLKLENCNVVAAPEVVVDGPSNGIN